MKLHKFLKTVPMKLYLILLAVILFSFFSNDFGLVDIQKTAIILAAGVDKTEEGFSLTSQIAVPKGSDRAQGGTSSVNITTQGETVSDCVTALFGKTGWVPKLVFCDLIVLGEEAAKEDVISYLNYFLRNEYMPDNCLLAVCEGKAEKLITSTSAIDDASSLAIEKLFSDAAEKSGKVMTNTLKDFAIDYYDVGKSSYLPYVKMSPQKGAIPGGDSVGSGSAGGSGGSGGSESEEQIYTAEETALFAEGKMVGKLPAEQTLALSLLEGNVLAGTFNAKEKGKPVTLTVVRNSGGVSLDMKGAPTAKLTVDVTCRLCCRGTTAPIEDISSDAVSPEILEDAKNVLKGYIEGLWNTCKEAKCDVLELKRKLYRSSLKKYEEWEEFLLTSVRPDISADVKSMK